MTIRMLTSQLELTITRRPGAPHVVRLNGARLVECDTLEEAERAKRAFELVLAPRFTRDEAIALCVAYEGTFTACGDKERTAYAAGMRDALEALAAAGVFTPCTNEQCDTGMVRFVDGERVGFRECPECSPSMSDKLDAAGIK